MVGTGGGILTVDRLLIVKTEWGTTEQPMYYDCTIMNVFGLADAVRYYPIIGGVDNEEGASIKVVRGACLLVFLLCVTIIIYSFIIMHPS